MEHLRMMQYLTFMEIKIWVFKKIGKLISPDNEEVKMNNRSRSAKLRIAEKYEKLFVIYKYRFLVKKDSIKIGKWLFI